MVASKRGRLARGFWEIRSLIQAALTPFGPGSEPEKNERIARSQNELRFFATTYFPHHLTAKPSLMHETHYTRFSRLILTAEATGQGGKEAHAAPRGHAKSTLATLILPLWCIAFKHRRFIGVISDTTEQAEEFLESIKAELEVNERLREDFPAVCGEGSTWKVGKILTRNGVKVTCWGKRKRLRGARFGNRRPDLMILDDLENDEQIDSPEQREKDRKWFFKAVMKSGAAGTVFIVIGTLLHYDSLLARLLTQPGWQGKKWQAILSPSHSPLWETWEALFSQPGSADAEKKADAFFSHHAQAMLAGTRVLWPEVEDYHYLMKMRVSDGPAFFDSEKQNEPINPQDCLFQEDWFRYWEDTAPFVCRENTVEPVYCAVDPSMGGASKHSDPSAIVFAAVREDGHIDVLEADIRKRHPDQILEDLLDHHSRFHFSRIAVEEVQFQELFKDQLIREAAQRGVYLPVEGVRPHGDKVLRISKLQPHIKNGVIRFRRQDRMLLEQLKYFPKASHDDGPDALEMLFGLISRGLDGPRIRRIG